mmetsp:Transcript_31647/g.87373  ORF Transcript_31647/g.87373 Transcript_31647/m.87373 type:complete len:413 (+) Transcript_31647:487-1725(+)
MPFCASSAASRASSSACRAAAAAARCTVHSCCASLQRCVASCKDSRAASRSETRRAIPSCRPSTSALHSWRRRCVSFDASSVAFLASDKACSMAKAVDSASLMPLAFSSSAAWSESFSSFAESKADLASRNCALAALCKSLFFWSCVRRDSTSRSSCWSWSPPCSIAAARKRFCSSTACSSSWTRALSSATKAQDWRSRSASCPTSVMSLCLSKDAFCTCPSSSRAVAARSSSVASICFSNSRIARAFSASSCFWEEACAAAHSERSFSNSDRFARSSSSRSARNRPSISATRRSAAFFSDSTSEHAAAATVRSASRAARKASMSRALPSSSSRVRALARASSCSMALERASCSRASDANVLALPRCSLTSSCVRASFSPRAFSCSRAPFRACSAVSWPRCAACIRSATDSP